MAYIVPTPQLNSGTPEHINFCMYMVETSRSPAAKNRWLREAEESEYAMYCKQREAGTA